MRFFDGVKIPYSSDSKSTHIFKEDMIYYIPAYLPFCYENVLKTCFILKWFHRLNFKKSCQRENYSLSILIAQIQFDFELLIMFFKRRLTIFYFEAEADSFQIVDFENLNHTILCLLIPRKFFVSVLFTHIQTKSNLFILRFLQRAIPQSGQDTGGYHKARRCLR